MCAFKIDFKTVKEKLLKLSNYRLRKFKPEWADIFVLLSYNEGELEESSLRQTAEKQALRA